MISFDVASVDVASARTPEKDDSNNRGTAFDSEGLFWMSTIKLTSDLVDRLRCPACGGDITVTENEIHCKSTVCSRGYPIVDGIPVLIDESKCLFTVEEIVSQHKSFFGSRSKAKEFVWTALPTLSKNIKAATNFRCFASLLGDSARVLVVGAGTEGEGFQALRESRIILIETDISLGPRANLVCDAHDIPFANETFDGCVIQAVLQHVVDPYRCVSEIHRVLKPAGLVYAETPFMQQVHGGRYDFTRFSHRGHRRLFRYFEEVESGVACGPAMAFAWAYQYFLICLFRSNFAQNIVFVFARLTSFWLKYLDHVLINRPNALYSASGFYFIGRKVTEPISDKKLVFEYPSAGSA
ncbi:MAG TPA: methyltransferase domain-containing protein [Bryobacteraceae bacterium]|nr:methyltransferase domain-containing protein [Bryobacteraceae bacterium]